MFSLLVIVGILFVLVMLLIVFEDYIIAYFNKPDKDQQINNTNNELREKFKGFVDNV